MQMWKKISASALAMSLAVNGLGGIEGAHASNTEVTRGEFVKSMIVGMGVELGTGKSVKFKDVPDSLKPYIEKAIELKIIAGKSATQFAPNEKLNREQAFVIAVRGIETDKPYSVKILKQKKTVVKFLVVFVMI